MEEISKIVKNSKIYKTKQTQLAEEEFKQLLEQIPEEARKIILENKLGKFSVTTIVNGIETRIYQEEDGIYKDEILEEVSL